jgi:hypothetical protein
MSNNTHTPGPWTVRNEHFRPLAILSADRASIVALLPDTAPKSNARLIAAAPEMLEALEELTEWGRTYTSPLDPNSPHQLLINAVNAIAKAKGL